MSSGEAFKETVFRINGGIDIGDYEQNIISDVLQGNRAVGVVAGLYKENLPISFISQFALDIWGCTQEEFLEKTQGKLLNLIEEDEREKFVAEFYGTEENLGEYRTCLLGKKTWVSILRRNGADSNGEKTWIISVRNVETQLQNEMQFCKPRCNFVI